MNETSGLASYPSLAGQRVFVTGGGSGIGAAIVKAFVAQGAQVAFVDLAQSESRALVAQLDPHNENRVWWRACDVRDLDALGKALRDAQAQLGDFSVLVNNVAHDERHRWEAVTPEYWEERMAVNQRPAFFTIQALVPGMRRLGFGSIINLGSTGWQTKGSNYPLYAIAKSSVNGLTRGMAANLGADRIRINTVTPGWVMTERQIKLWLDTQGKEELKRNQCLPDRLQATDIARMVLFLASTDGAMCTAQEFKVDAGWS